MVRELRPEQRQSREAAFLRSIQAPQMQILALIGYKPKCMKSRLGIFAFRFFLAIACGVILRQVVDLHPDWWAVWLAPGLLLTIALRYPPRTAPWMVALAAVMGTSVNFHYFRLVMPLTGAMLSVVLQALLWTFLVLASSRVVLRYRAWWTVFVYPVLWVAADTLMAALLPDGDWGSLAYSQGDNLLVLQIASVFGMCGVLFLLALVPSALAMAVGLGNGVRRGWLAYASTVVLLGASPLYGYFRLQTPVSGTPVVFGLISIDNPIGVKASAQYAANILDEYDRRVAGLAVQGAQYVVLPEKIGVFRPAAADDEKHRLSADAQQDHVWLEAGIGIDDGTRPTNWAWLFAPDGSLAASYEKHHMAPPERRENYAVGHDYTVATVDGGRWGMAICKDMHFAALGREYGERHAAVMLVPAWDFAYLDGWLEARTTVMRGIENGYSIVRASREGLLTVSDPYGRILAETASSAMPGRSLLVKAQIPPQVQTLYTRSGNLLGWFCVVAAAVFLAMGRGRPALRDIT
jgi:apolipoprotein N-acyltransferase